MAIVQLDEHLANMIAAGEVVEKPSSVVKELVENSIDAKASQITINLLESGTKLIEVIDNGSGMSESDAKMCFKRHATSKIKTEYDLFRIGTLGFRGEAIPSIASISKFSLFTSDGKDSTNVNYNAGKLISVLPCAMNKGTRICVENLFYNVPARLKYLRSLKTELNSISYLVSKFILANPTISFKLTNDNKTIYQTNGSNNIVEIFGSIYGLDVARNLLFDSFSDTGYKMDIVVTKNNISRSNNLEITTVINGRFIRSQAISEAVVSAYKTLIPEGRYPIGLIKIDIDPLLIDVNVHPSKMTIKIASEQQMAFLLTSHIKALLETNNLIPEVKPVIKEEKYKKETIFDKTLEVKEELVAKEDIKPYPKLSEKENSISLNEEVFSFKNLEKTKAQSEEVVVQTSSEDVPESLKYSDKRLPKLNYIGSVHATYLLFESQDGLYIMDQHAAAERVNYEYYYEVLSKPKGEHIELLIPQNIELTREEMSKLEELSDSFKKLGFTFNQSGENSYFIREIPVWLHLEDLDNLIHDLLLNFSSNLEENIMRYRDNISKQIACKASLKANHNITRDEVDTLVKNLSKCKRPFTCPHGRPTIIKFSKADLEKLFMRTM